MNLIKNSLPSIQSKATLAIARHIPNSFLHALVTHHTTNNDDDTSNDKNNDNQVCLTKARAQHMTYLQQLRHHIPTVCLPPLEDHPDCLFVEDTVVCVGNVACLTSMSEMTRRGEVDSIKGVLDMLGMDVVDMREYNDNIDGDFDFTSNNMTASVDGKNKRPYCDGGDVLYTGRHLFVGLSHRTNELGYNVLKDVFGSTVEVVKVPPLIQGRNVLHLKSAVTHIDEETLLAPTGPLGDQLLNIFTPHGYNAIRLPDILSCNAVSINGHVLAQDKCEVSKQRIEMACNERGLDVSFVDTGELAKKDAALTCCSVLLRL